MEHRQKVYCGTKQILPEGYARFARRFQCLRKGYGACLYAGRLGRGRRGAQQQRLLRRISFRVGFMLAVFAVLMVLAYYLLSRRQPE